MLKNKYFITLAYILVTLGTLIGSSVLLKPVEKRNKINLYKDKYNDFIENLELVDVLDIEHPIITEIVLAKDAEGNELVLYGARQNNDYGFIEFKLALNGNGEVVEIEATKIDQTRSEAIIGELTSLIVDMKNQTVSVPGGNVAQATIGSESIKDMFEAIEYHFFNLLYSYGPIIQINEGGIVSKQEVYMNGILVGKIVVVEKTLTSETHEEYLKGALRLDLEDNLISYQMLEYSTTEQGNNNLTINDLLNLLEEGN